MCNRSARNFQEFIGKKVSRLREKKIFVLILWIPGPRLEFWFSFIIVHVGSLTMINTLIIIQWANWAMMQGHRLSDLHAALQGKRRSCWEATENRRDAYTPLIVVFSFYNGTRWWTIHLLPYHSWINNRLSIHTYCCIFLADMSIGYIQSQGPKDNLYVYLNFFFSMLIKEGDNAMFTIYFYRAALIYSGGNALNFCS